MGTCARYCRPGPGRRRGRQTCQPLWGRPSGSLLEAYEKAFECDPMSAFGGIVALSGPVDEELAAAMVANAKADVVIAPQYSEQALSIFAL